MYIYTVYLLPIGRRQFLAGYVSLPEGTAQIRPRYRNVSTTKAPIQCACCMLKVQIKHGAPYHCTLASRPGDLQNFCNFSKYVLLNGFVKHTKEKSLSLIHMCCLLEDSIIGKLNSIADYYHPYQINQPTSFGQSALQKNSLVHQKGFHWASKRRIRGLKQDGTNVANITKSDVLRNSRKTRNSEFLLGNLFRFLQGLRGMSPLPHLKIGWRNWKIDNNNNKRFSGSKKHVTMIKKISLDIFSWTYVSWIYGCFQ